ncbi:UNKNOWN [Stylonychia lemnae]|uniref:Uncharacterized protein n=1 Tax=Stylonychia lemnae TaxID=5949 RepID=A0A078B2C9_STYLE|nr:UNKNOWN [Stylonychia lemnae]|eukprot:CDW88649.1 UNKNOWN [Stylonychia lemnae]
MVTIELICSHLSGKKKVFRDGKCIFDIQRFGTSFQYPFQINNHMLNIIQHGEMFELRIDNQSFQHLFNQDKTRKAFVFDGEENPQQTNKFDNYESNLGKDRREDDYNISSYKANENNDYGYGGYKKGHSDVNPNWNNNNNVNGGFDSDNIRNKPYDSYSPQRENTKSNNSQNANRSNAGNSNNGGLTYFSNFDQGVKFKKAEYISKADGGNNGDNLLDLGFGGGPSGHSQQIGNQNFKSNNNIGNNNFFDFDFNATANQNSSAQNNTFDFDFPGGQTQNTNSNINSKQQQNKQAAVFDFNSYNSINTSTQVNQQQQKQQQTQPSVNTLDDLFQSSQPQPQNSLDDLFNASSVPQVNNTNQSLNFEEQRRIQELIQTGYNQQQNLGAIRQNQSQQQQQQFVPNPMANMGSNFNIQQQQQYQQQQQNLGGFQFNNFQFNNANNQQIGKDKENLESKLVNLDCLGGGVSSNNQGLGGKSNQDPFTDAFSNNTRSAIPMSNQKDAFSFVQNQITTDISPDNHTQTKQRSSLLGNKGVITSDQMTVNFSSTATQNTNIGFAQTTQNSKSNNENDFFFGFNAQANQNTQNQQQDNDFKFF